MKVWGLEVHPPNLDRRLAAFLLDRGWMGRAERRLFERTIRPGQVVVDVGANQGILTLLFSRLVGESGRVLALEPEPLLFESLERSCRANGVANVTRLRVAAGEGRTTGVLHRSRFNSGDNRLTDSVLADSAVGVEIAPLDELLPDGRVDFVKIDVQGYEMKVLRGMEGILERSAGIQVYFEYWPQGLRHAGSAPTDPLTFLGDRGFEFFEAEGDGQRKLGIDEIIRTTGGGHFSYRNFLAARG